AERGVDDGAEVGRRVAGGGGDPPEAVDALGAQRVHPPGDDGAQEAVLRAEVEVDGGRVPGAGGADDLAERNALDAALREEALGRIEQAVARVAKAGTACSTHRPHGSAGGCFNASALKLSGSASPASPSSRSRSEDRPRRRLHEAGGVVEDEARANRTACRLIERRHVAPWRGVKGAQRGGVEG